MLTGCRKGAVPAALMEQGPRAAATEVDPRRRVRGAPTSPSSCGTTATRSTRRATTRSPRSAVEWGVDVVATNNVHYATPAWFRLATTLAAVRARRAVGRDRGVAAARAGGVSALGRRAGAALRPLARRHRAGRRARARPARSTSAWSRRGCRTSPSPTAWTSRATCASSSHEGRDGALRAAASAERVPGAWEQIDHELDGDRRARASRATSSSCGTSPSSAGARHLLPGPGLGGQLGGLLRARGHQCRRGRRSACSSSGSCRRRATARLTSTWTSSRRGAKR